EGMGHSWCCPRPPHGARLRPVGLPHNRREDDGGLGDERCHVPSDLRRVGANRHDSDAVGAGHPNMSARAPYDLASRTLDVAPVAPTPQSKRRLLALAALPKDVDDMSDDELDAFVDEF